MDLDAFRSRLGEGQGRTQVAPDQYRFVLGDIEPGRQFDLVVGDFSEVVQSTDLTGVTLIRAQFTVRVPPGPAWEASIVVDGTKMSRTTCEPGRTRVVTDMAANVSKFSGVHEVGIRLELGST